MWWSMHGIIPRVACFLPCQIKKCIRGLQLEQKEHVHLCPALLCPPAQTSSVTLSSRPSRSSTPSSAVMGTILNVTSYRPDMQSSQSSTSLMQTRRPCQQELWCEPFS